MTRVRPRLVKVAAVSVAGAALALLLVGTPAGAADRGSGQARGAATPI